MYWTECIKYLTPCTSARGRLINNTIVVSDSMVQCFDLTPATHLSAEGFWKQQCIPVGYVQSIAVAVSLAIHAPCHTHPFLPCIPTCYACPSLCMPRLPCTSPLPCPCHACPPDTHALLPCMPPATHAPCHTCPPAMHTSPLLIE